ncbi:phosphate signaling complex protein PhoU [bacterium]|nr:phosphate signaling complex protein PhoU [bacterium]
MPDSFEHFLAERLQAEAILESLAEGVVAVDLNGAFVAINPAARALLGLGHQSVIGNSLFETVRQRDLHELVREVLSGGKLILREIPIFVPRERILRVQGVPCSAPGPGGARVVLLLQDVTDQHRYDQLRREFVANVSHELKSPLTSIRSLTETLLDGGLEDPSCNRRFVTLIEEDSTRLARLIDDLLILSQVESRAVPLRLSAVELDEVVQNVLAPREILIAEKRLRIVNRLDRDLQVRADPDRLRQVLDNLLDNAIKYSPDGGRVEVLAYPVEQNRVEVRVHDQGPGIPPEARGRVFERFYRVDKNRSRELGGTGLGLSIVKHIVESHGGRAWVEGTLGEGSQFCFTLQLATPQEGEVVAPSHRLIEPSQALSSPAEDELGHLQERLLVMAGLVEEAVGRSVQALVLRDAKLARQVMKLDHDIDRSELVIDEICLRLMAERHPAGTDLRLVAMAFKINADLERIGDLAVNIAERTLDLLRQPLLLPLVDLQTMAELVQNMVKASLDALVQRDVEGAQEVCRRDIVVDSLNRQIFESMLGLMSSQPQNADRALALLLVGRSLERIADHATNIAENVVYLVTGRTVKHRATLT